MLTRFPQKKIQSFVLTSIDAESDWFSSNIVMSEATNYAIRHTIMIRLEKPSKVVVELDDSDNADVRMFLNGGSALPAFGLYMADIMLVAGQTYNIKHATDSQRITGTVVESRDAVITPPQGTGLSAGELPILTEGAVKYLSVGSVTEAGLMTEMLNQMKIMNVHLSLMTCENVTHSEIN